LAANEGQIVGRNVLHFAPEAVLRRKIAPLAGTYRAADIDPRFADIVLNIENIDLPDESVDVIVCSHILEHVDHARALAELRRVLTRDGVLLMLFPIVEGWDETYRNGAMTSPAERDLHFGQYDHIQYFGRGVRRDIAAAGFDLAEFTAVEPDVSAHALTRGEKLFIARPNRSA
jgi:ubiquinone/menaquinone biosynthesis C-methylase UbiE